jgi:hypothetical protein
MRIEVQGQPTAGRMLRAVVYDGVGVTSTTAAIDGVAVFQSDCPDPPCHEMFMIPSDAVGAVLTIEAKDSKGNRDRASFSIVPSTTGGTPAPSRGGAQSMGA